MPCFHKLENTQVAHPLHSKSFVFFFLQKNNFKSHRYFARCFKSLIAKFNINMLLRISHTFSKTVLERIYFTENTQRCTGTCLVAVTLAYSIPGHSKTKYVWEREKTKTVTCRCIDTVWLLDLSLAEKSSNLEGARSSAFHSTTEK